jgi:hypothetical protein
MARFNFYQGSFTVAYLIFKGKKNTPYYQRRVPDDLAKRFGKKLLRIKLDARQGSPASQAERLGAYHDTLIASMRSDDSITLPAEKNAALGLLYHYGLKQGIELNTPKEKAFMTKESTEKIGEQLGLFK